MNRLIRLNELSPGQKGVVKKICVSGHMRRRLLDIGLVENTVIECIGRSPCGDPAAYLIRGAVIAIRCESCREIFIQI